ncbi:hypothetical protein D3C80_1181480 [compost metagenome]
MIQQPGTHQRRQRRGKGYQRHNGGEHAVSLAFAIAVNYQGLPGNGSRANPNRLDKAQRPKLHGILHPQHAEAAEGKQRQTDQQHRFTAEAIGKRAPQQLCKGKPGQEDAQAGADCPGGNLQILLHHAEGGQVHIGGQVSQHAQAGKVEHKTKGISHGISR